MAWICVSQNVPRSEVRNVNGDRSGADQGIIVILSQSDRKPGGKVSDAAEAPAADQHSLPTGAGESIERQQPAVAEDKIVCYVEVAQGNALARVEWIGRVLQAGSIVDALAEGVTSEKA